MADWPDWCFCPLAASADIIAGSQKSVGINHRALYDVARIGALAAWRVTQTVYRFDPDMLSALIDSSITNLPIDVLFHLPEWCMYIETPGLYWLSRPLAGFFVHLEYDIRTGRPELRFLFDTDEADGPSLFAQQLHLTVATLDQAVEEAINEAKRHMGHMMTGGGPGLEPATPTSFLKTMATAVQPALSLVLYLCSRSVDIQGERPQRPRQKKTKKGWKIFPPEHPNIVEVGYAIGSALRSSRQTEESAEEGDNDFTDRKAPRPHVCKAHWHHFWTGAQGGERQCVLKWLPPIPVNINTIDDLPLTVKHVTKG